MKPGKFAHLLMSGSLLLAGGCAGVPAAYTANAEIPANLRGNATSTCTMRPMYGISAKFILSAPSESSEIEYLRVEMAMDLNQSGPMMGMTEDDLNASANFSKKEEMSSMLTEMMAESFGVDKKAIESSFENNIIKVSVTMDSTAVIEAYNSQTHAPMNSLIFSEIIQQLENQTLDDQQVIFCE